ncbi:MAG: tyrosine-type recombinase/integrase [Desulfamplus sp.]|nr:tyrosine-type recombinase/integrase [Desulfamplus sp.]
MSQAEVSCVLGNMQGLHLFMAKLLYGSGLRLMECIHLLENGVNIRVVQELMGHADVKTTEIYTHVMEKNIPAVQSPLDRLG